MANFTKMAFTPEKGLNDRDAYPATPLSESEARNSIQGISDQIKNYINNILIAQLHSSITSASGSERIGSAEIQNLAGNTVWSQIASLAATIFNVTNGLAVPGNNTVSTDKIQDDAVTDIKIAANAVTTTKIIDGAITSDKIASGSITSDKIAADAVDGNSLTNLSITGDKIADNQINENKILSGAVISTKIAANAVTSDKIANEAVNTEKLGQVSSITMATGDTISYNNSNDKLMLNVAGCIPVQLCPVVYGTGPAPSAGSYPAGTLYIQYQA